MWDNICYQGMWNASTLIVLPTRELGTFFEWKKHNFETLHDIMISCIRAEEASELIFDLQLLVGKFKVSDLNIQFEYEEYFKVK